MKWFVFSTVLLFSTLLISQTLQTPWSGYAHDPQHTADSANASQSLVRKHWSTPVDTNVPNGEIFIHYASPMVTAANTVLLPVKFWNGSTDAFKVQAFAAGVSGASPVPMYELASDYILPPHNWIPPFGATLAFRNRIYYACAGGTVCYRDSVDSATGPTGRIAFYGNAVYNNPANTATLNNTVMISTPLVAGRSGDIFFGFVVTGSNPAGLVSGVARISYTGAGTWISAQAASGGDGSITQVPLNCTPTLNNTQTTLYFAVSTGYMGSGYLVSVNASNLAPISHIALNDPRGASATLLSDSSASPMVGPDGDVYYGVLENPCCDSHNDRGWMLHFNSTLSQTKTPGSFGWDTTASVVPKALVSSYSGSSAYLILTKYNNYFGSGSGDGVNKVAILDPNATMPDPVSPSVSVMKEVITVTGVTPEGSLPAVREWCINTAVVDPFTKSAIINSEDGTVYRWDFTSNSLSQSVFLNTPIGESYTPTAIGPDGTMYAINDAVLYALGN